MLAHIALASCSLWPTGSGDHAGLAGAVADRGVRAEWVPWDDPTVDWSDYDLVLLRETWDYPPKLAAFLAWVDSVAKLTSLVNPSAVVSWNHHKRYLQELAAVGVPTVPTTVVTTGSTDPHAAVRAAGAAMVVVKPAVGIGGNDAERGRADDPATAAHLRALLAGGDVLVQPYLQSIEASGETSLVVLGGRVTHAVTKLPARASSGFTSIVGGATPRSSRPRRRSSWRSGHARRRAPSPAKTCCTPGPTWWRATTDARCSWSWS